MKEVAGSEEFYECELCLLALGFLGPEEGMIKALGLQQDPRSNIVTNTPDKPRPFAYQTSIEGVFAAGDCRRGQSLVVCTYYYSSPPPSFPSWITDPFFVRLWITGGIQEGRAAAVDVDNFLSGNATSKLPARGSIKHRDFAVDAFGPTLAA
jgi:glutamate synthase (NADPH/NADH)